MKVLTHYEAGLRQAVAILLHLHQAYCLNIYLYQNKVLLPKSKMILRHMGLKSPLSREKTYNRIWDMSFN